MVPLKVGEDDPPDGSIQPSLITPASAGLVFPASPAAKSQEDDTANQTWHGEVGHQDGGTEMNAIEAALAEARANMDALSAIAVATASMGRPDVMSGGVDPQTPKRTDASARRRTSRLSQSATPRTPQLSGSSSSPALLSMPHPIADTPPPQDANNGGGGNGNGSGAALGPVLIHPSKQARELRRAKRRQRSTDVAEPTAAEVEALRLIVGRRLSDFDEDALVRSALKPGLASAHELCIPQPIKKFIAGDMSKLDDVMVQSVTTGALIPMRMFWYESPVVVCFLRRFGCQMCRYGCSMISMLAPVLARHGVKLVAIGKDDYLDDFTQGGYFNGEVFIDRELTCYKRLALGKGRWSDAVGVAMGFGDAVSRETYKLATTAKIPFNAQGLLGSTQLGATYVVNISGQIVMEHRMTKLGDLCSNDDILLSLGLDPDRPYSSAEHNRTRKTDPLSPNHWLT